MARSTVAKEATAAAAADEVEEAAAAAAVKVVEEGSAAGGGGGGDLDRDGAGGRAAKAGAGDHRLRTIRSSAGEGGDHESAELERASDTAHNPKVLWRPKPAGH